MKYICTECTGNTGEEHTFHLDREPKACPFYGHEERHISTIEEWLRTELSDARWDANHWEEKYYELKEEAEDRNA